jgi:hypothetical protein
MAEELGYTPSFTARAIGIEPIEVTMAQAEKLISGVQTGFELRAPVILKSGRAGQIKTGLSKKIMAQLMGKQIKQRKFKTTTFKMPKFKMPKFKGID